MKAFCHICSELIDLSRMAEHRAAHAEQGKQGYRKARRERLGYGDPEVRRTMAQVVKRDGECLMCGSTVGLTAHYLPGGKHLPVAEMFTTLCRSCHGKVEGGKRGDRDRDD
jgi:hypothetical protein